MPTVAAFLVRKTTGLDLREARWPHPVPAIGPVNTVSVDQRDPGDQAAPAADDDRLVDRELTQPADLGALEFCQRQASIRQYRRRQFQRRAATNLSRPMIVSPPDRFGT
jgi:hypothetical protein